MRSDQSYLALDLELDKGDIIEVGIAIGPPSADPSAWHRQSWLLYPRHGRPLDERIVQLTGITDEEIALFSVSHDTVKSELVRLVDIHKPFVNPVQWGLGDAQELLDELDDVTGSRPPIFGRRVIDVKHHYLYIEAANGRAMSGGLRRAMAAHGVEFEGRSHRAGDDAFNTLKFYFHLLNRQHVIEDFLKWKNCLAR